METIVYLDRKLSQRRMEKSSDVEERGKERKYRPVCCVRLTINHRGVERGYSNVLLQLLKPFHS